MKHIGFGVSSPILDDFKNDYISKLSYFVDNKKAKQGTKMRGLDVFPPDVLLNENKDDIFIWVFSNVSGSEISEQLKEMGFIEGKHFINIYNVSKTEICNNNSALITLYPPRIEQMNKKSRLICELDDDGERKNLWLEVDAEYEKYLFYERSDAFLIAVLLYAMKNGKDIKCLSPVTDELLCNIETVLIPILTKFNDEILYETKIFCDTTCESIAGAWGVGTGVSGGVDSFHAIKRFVNSKYESMRLTHLCIFNLGSFPGAWEDELRLSRFEYAKKIADEVRLPLVEIDSNIFSLFPYSNTNTDSYLCCFVIIALRKLFKTYYRASDYEITRFSISTKDFSNYYQILLFEVFSNFGIKFYSEGIEKTRIEKELEVIDFEMAEKYLHVCRKRAKHCGTCEKCRRILLLLDFTEKLDKYREIFDIDYFLQHRNEYYEWLADNKLPSDYLKQEIRDFFLKNINKIRHFDSTNSYK